MKIVNVHEAKSQLSKLIEQVEAGEDVVIARAGKPAVRLIAFKAEARPRVGGVWRNQVRMTDDFDVLPEAWLSVFEGHGV